MQARASLLLLSLLVLITASCVFTKSLKITLNGISEEFSELLIVPPSGFTINLTYGSSGASLIPSSLEVVATNWNGVEYDLSAIMGASSSSAVGIVPAGSALPTGSYTLRAQIWDTNNNSIFQFFDFAVREFPYGAPPIVTGQIIWLDFLSEFSADLEAVGLGSPVSPGLSAIVEVAAIDATLARVQEVYSDSDPSGLGADPVEVVFSSSDPGSGDVTRICVGGDQGNLIGAVLIDKDNVNKTSVECGTIPPAGVFARGISNVYGPQASFKTVFDPLLISAGGTPVGEHALDSIVLDPGFDPGSATSEELDRYNTILVAILTYANALGTVTAHEVGHALGLVPDGAPGVGFYGDTSSHNSTPEGTPPADTYLMNAGNTFNFARLAGLEGNPLPEFRPMNWAYLRDRLVRDSSVTELLFPPSISGFDPLQAGASWTQLTVSGADFANLPKIRLVSETYVYEMEFEQFVSPTTVTAWVNPISIPSGSYALHLENPDGQLTIGAGTFLVP